MSKFLVGGAVRDLLMGLDPKDMDYVVVGSTPEEMLDAGFTQVGADFPVFLHNDTGEEYALARRERKTGKGYLGFESDFNSDVTLTEDLMRRDLTVNSIALKDGVYIDPFGGLADIEAKVLRHTSTAFEEDPVRVLRLARFRARFGPDWTVANETKTLIYKMNKSGCLHELQPERIWKEMSRALMEPYARLFFDTLLECDALKTIFPDIYNLASALESIRWHPEGNAYEHTMLVLNQAVAFDFPLEVRFAALVHDFGKGLTPKHLMPSHFGHDVNGVNVVRVFSNSLTVPAKMRDRAMKATRYHMLLHKLDTLNPKTFVKMFDDMAVMNDPEAVYVLYCVGVCDERGRLGSENNEYGHLDQLNESFGAYSSVKFADLFPNGESKPEKIKNAFRSARIKTVAEVKKKFV